VKFSHGHPVNLRMLLT